MIVGAGLAGIVAAERLAAEANKKIIIVEKRNHIGGNAYDEFDEHGILVHRYGPHIFHTNSKLVYDYLSKFTSWIHYEHKVLANLNGKLYPFPINRITINKLYKLKLASSKEVQEFLERIREQRLPILNSEDVIVNQVGYDLFEKFYKNYTKKQWNLEPKDLAPSVCGRIPVRLDDDQRYFSDKYQYMPKDGYSTMFRKMISNRNIDVILNTDYKYLLNDVKFVKMIFTGPIDYFFDYEFGKLPYRSIRFEWENLKMKDFLPAAQVNFVGDEKYTRVVEHKKLSNQNIDTTTMSYEYPTFDGEPFYPIPNEMNRNLYHKYKTRAEKLNSVFFLGRLAEYQYYNMDQVIGNVLHLLKSF